MGNPINYSAPTGQVQNTYAAATRTNPYLTSSQYNNMQLHTPSGYYYQGGKMYEPYTPTPASTSAIYANTPSNGPFAFSTQSAYGPNSNTPFGRGNVSYKTTGGPVEGSVQSGDQYFKPYTGNAPGIINGDISMIYGLGNRTTPTYSAQQMPNLFSGLNTNFYQSQPTGSMLGAGRFLGNTTSSLPIVTTNTQGK
jgi:hypothetical protein